MVSVWDAKHFPKASHLSGQHFLQDIRCQCTGFEGVQQYLNYQGSALVWSLSLEMYAFRSRWSSISLVPLLSVKFWTALQAWNLDLWRLHPDTWSYQSGQFLTVHSDVNADPICVVGHQSGLLCTNFHAKGCRGLISRQSTGEASSSCMGLPGHQCHQQKDEALFANYFFDSYDILHNYSIQLVRLLVFGTFGPRKLL